MSSDSGFQRFSDYTGYSDTFEWKCEHTDQCRLVDNMPLKPFMYYRWAKFGAHLNAECVQQKDLTVEMF